MTNNKQSLEESEQLKKDSNQNIQNKEQSKKDDIENKILRVSSYEYSGPIPHPDILRGYNEIGPNILTTIMTMSEKEQNFRHKSISLGQNSAIIIGVAGLISTTILGIYGNPWLAGGIGFLSLGSLVAKFFYKTK